MTALETDATAWRVRPFLLAAIGALAAMVVHHLLNTVAPPPVWRTALGCGIAVATFAFGFSLERTRIGWAIGFAAALGLVAGLILYWNDVPQMGTWGDWRYASLLLAVVIPVPLFQVANARGAWRFPYDEVHAAAWTNVVLWCACWAFVGVAFALAWLLAGLFGLIGLHFLRDLLGHGWAVALLFGAAFGGALGLLRERAGVVLLLQRVVTTVLGVLAPVLAIGLLFFLVALPFTGLGALWEATKATTPILLTCVIGALILANAVIGDGADDEVRNPLLRYGAMTLAVTMLPLAAIAALATTLRIQQYGYSPDRLWALVFVILASVYAVAYLGSVVRGRRDWAAFARDANLKLAFVVAGVALLLATPLLSFNAISTRDQVARLTSGKVSPDKFDWAALAFDFGEPGKAAIRQLARQGNLVQRLYAETALKATYRGEISDGGKPAIDLERVKKRLRILPSGGLVPDALLPNLNDWELCRDDASTCTIFVASAQEVFVFRGNCYETVDQRINGSRSPNERIGEIGYEGDCALPAHLLLRQGRWNRVEPPLGSGSAEDSRKLKDAMARGDVDVRRVDARQVFVGGVPVGNPFE